MSETIDQIIQQIEELRLSLIKIKEGRSYTDKEVVTASQRLDQVLNKYQELINQHGG
ncbi:aspartyl-phosphate phosphatase Spo0E family protein [Desulfosporosinus sp. BG]|uniref:aspartyl-phosphate phosphatase Spo0E family protein n=1 Tax=Desulfosporosinus sp. BG TaxID=1633135 RepID=UPI000839E0A6|nr:aspartyl-phosphate phosphatase Spo0E family protein [Desulfosporosinus sp. BG]ODA40803.1 hypothetical protein DSBG_2379 [Desulfosporosinus sp. BG]